LTVDPEWLAEAIGAIPRDTKLYQRALTHGSFGSDTYERLEFLGDRVLGLVVSRWLYDMFEGDAEGKLSFRFNSLVAGATCATVGRNIGVTPHIRLGKQARDDGAFDSDNVIGDVIEALIGALYLDHGLDAAQAFIRRHWEPLLSGQSGAPRHPKSALQEWAAAHNRKPPAYTVTDRSGPHHAPRFTVKVSLGSAGEAEAEGRSKQEAESAAAEALLSKLS
jgi:ribonuclease III